jgi:hypothetical protein
MLITCDDDSTGTGATSAAGGAAEAAVVVTDAMVADNDACAALDTDAGGCGTGVTDGGCGCSSVGWVV